MNPTAHDWFAGLLSTGQWLVIFIVLGIILAVVFTGITVSAGLEDDAPASFWGGLFAPFLLWFVIMLILHFVSFLVGLWNWDFVPVVRS